MKNTSDQYWVSEGRWMKDPRRVRRELKFMMALKKEGHDVDEAFVDYLTRLMIAQQQGDQ